MACRRPGWRSRKVHDELLGHVQEASQRPLLNPAIVLMADHASAEHAYHLTTQLLHAELYVDAL